MLSRFQSVKTGHPAVCRNCGEPGDYHVGRLQRCNSVRSLVRAFCMGFGDGWRQPQYLSSTWNVEHLPGCFADNQEALDIGATWGQRVRSPLHHQRLEDA